MKVFIHGSEGRLPPPLHVKFVSPAAHLGGEEVPASWVDHDNKPRTFTIEFVHGCAEVGDELGRYLVKTGQAHRSRLVLPSYFGSAFGAA